MFLEISQNLQKNNCARANLSKEALAQVFSCEFSEISENTFSTERLWATACFCETFSFLSFYLYRKLVATLENAELPVRWKAEVTTIKRLFVLETGRKIFCPAFIKFFQPGRDRQDGINSVPTFCAWIIEVVI